MSNDNFFLTHSHIASSHSLHSFLSMTLTKLYATKFKFKKLYKTPARNNVNKANYVSYVPLLCDYPDRNAGQVVLKKIIAILIISSLSLSLSAQETKEKNWTIQGYTKSLQSLFNLNIPGIGDQTISDNFLHNRLNFNWYPSDNWTFKAGLRTRFFFGEFTRNQTDFNASLNEGANDVLNLTLLNVGEKNVLHSYLDRAYFQYNKDNLEVRFGRQRINWGINTVWNPNDLFNAFTFTDFDYEERPGSDALRVQYYIGYAGSIEFAIKAFDNTDEIVAASLYKFNKWNYDFQVLAGWSNKDIVLGGGWAGNIKDWGFKGEFSWFSSTIESVDNNFVATLSGDYSFENGLFLASGVLYNQAGTETNNSNIFNFELSARNLYPYRWSVFTSAGFPITPLFNANIAVIYSPISGHPLFLTPTFTYSLGQNLDVDFVTQIILEERIGSFGSNIQAYFLRVKWSY